MSSVDVLYNIRHKVCHKTKSTIRKPSFSFDCACFHDVKTNFNNLFQTITIKAEVSPLHRKKFHLTSASTSNPYPCRGPHVILSPAAHRCRTEASGRRRTVRRVQRGPQAVRKGPLPPYDQVLLPAEGPADDRYPQHIRFQPSVRLRRQVRVPQGGYRPPAAP